MSDATEITKKHSYGTWRFQKNYAPKHIVEAEGCWLIDSSGKRYLDFSSQLVCSNLGHKNQKVIQAICDQAQSLPYIGPAFTTSIRAELIELLLEVLPAGLDKFMFVPTGTEANEAAIKIARQYTGKHKIISRYASYHGSTAGSIALTGDFRRWPAEPVGKMGGGIFAPDANCYRCPFGLKHPSCSIACADYLSYMIDKENDVAAVIVEPIVGTNGVLVPPAEYLPKLREITEKRGVLLIADEVMTGWGRTGKWFAVQHWNITPDILTTAKGITGAYAPLGLCATSKKIGNYFDEHYFAHGYTYDSHALTLAAAVAAIGEYRRLNLIERARILGIELGEKLTQLKSKHSLIGDVRGLGLFWAVELVKDRSTKLPSGTQQEKLEGKVQLVDRIAAEMMSKGVFVMSWVSHLVISPPLTITSEEIDIGIKSLDEALNIHKDG